MTDPGSSSGGIISQWADMAHAQADMVRAVGEYQHNVARAQAVGVASEGDAVVVAMKKIDLQALRIFYQQLLRQRSQFFAKKREIEAKVRAVQRLYNWENLWPDAISGAWSGWQFFYQQAPPSAHAALATISVPGTARPGTNFSFNRLRTQECDPCPSHIANAIGFITWLRLKHYMPRGGSPASEVVTAALDAVGQVAAEKLAELKGWLKEMQDGTFNTFSPMAIANLKTNQALEGPEK